MKSSLKHARRTKIVATIGPATETRESIEALIDAGMNVARLNFSHADAAWHRDRIQLLRDVAAERNKTIGILIDCPGPKLRIGKIPGGPIALPSGERFRVVTNDTPGSHEGVSVSYAPLPAEGGGGRQGRGHGADALWVRTARAARSDRALATRAGRRRARRAG